MPYVGGHGVANQMQQLQLALLHKAPDRQVALAGIEQAAVQAAMLSCQHCLQQPLAASAVTWQCSALLQPQWDLESS
jgi:hypothetical protein